jgi:hypothetical protein
MLAQIYNELNLQTAEIFRIPFPGTSKSIKSLSYRKSKFQILSSQKNTSPSKYQIFDIDKIDTQIKKKRTSKIIYKARVLKGRPEKH